MKLYDYNVKDASGDIISNIEFTGGCNGNLKAIPKLIEGWTVDLIEEKCAGNLCGRRPTRNINIESRGILNEQSSGVFKKISNFLLSDRRRYIFVPITKNHASSRSQKIRR